jgi:hypothetical protein
MLRADAFKATRRSSMSLGAQKETCVLKGVLQSIGAALRGGSRTFSLAESRLLSAVVDALPEHERAVLKAQIDGVSLVQRQHPGRLVVAFYPRSLHLPVLPYPGYEYCLAKVTYKSKGRRKSTAVVLHDGRLMSLERNVPDQAADVEELVKVEIHPGGRSDVANEIDAEEHGRA